MINGLIISSNRNKVSFFKSIVLSIRLRSLLISYGEKSVRAIGIELSLVLVILLIEELYKERFWCKFACPVGATLAFLRAKHTLSIHYDAKICSEQCPVDKFKLSLCNSACPLNLNPRLINEKQNNIYPYCFNCGECVDACQNKGSEAIFFTFHPGKTKKGVIR